MSRFPHSSSSFGGSFAPPDDIDEDDELNDEDELAEEEGETSLDRHDRHEDYEYPEWDEEHDDEE